MEEHQVCTSSSSNTEDEDDVVIFQGTFPQDQDSHQAPSRSSDKAHWGSHVGRPASASVTVPKVTSDMTDLMSFHNAVILSRSSSLASTLVATPGRPENIPLPPSLSGLFESPSLPHASPSSQSQPQPKPQPQPQLQPPAVLASPEAPPAVSSLGSKKRNGSNGTVSPLLNAHAVPDIRTSEAALSYGGAESPGLSGPDSESDHLTVPLPVGRHELSTRSSGSISSLYQPALQNVSGSPLPVPRKSLTLSAGLQPVSSSRGAATRLCGQLLVSNALYYKFFRICMAVLLILTPGLVCHFLFPRWTLFSESQTVLYWTGLAAVLLVGYWAIFFVLQLLLYVFHRHESLFAASPFMYHLSELKGYVAFFLYVVLLGCFWNFTGLHATPLWAAWRNAVNKTLFAFSLGIVFFGYKSHLIQSMAMSFNYTNFIDRIQECLFADHMIHALSKAKNTYKARRREWLRSLPLAVTGTLPHSTHHTFQSWTGLTSTFKKDKRPVAQPVLRKDTIIDISEEETARIKAAVPDKPSPEPKAAAGIEAVESMENASFMQQQSFNPFNVRYELAEFYKIAQRVSSQFEESVISSYTSSSSKMSSVDAGSSSSSSAKSNSEIRREAKVLAKKYYKWLLPPDVGFKRVHLVKDDFMVPLKSQADVNRLWNMLCCSHEASVASPVSPSKMAPHSPSQQTLDHFFTHHSSIPRHDTSLLRQASSSLKTSQNVPASGVTLAHLTDFIERTYREIIGLSKSLRSMEAAVRKLDIFFSILCLVLLLIFLALLFGDFLAALTSISSLIFGAAFMFGSSAKNVFESIIFLFVSHPFDVGDRVYINLNFGSAVSPAPAYVGSYHLGFGANNLPPTLASNALENLVVSEMHLITTIFERWDGARIYIPNYVLATKPIINVRRSGALLEVHRLQVDFNTPIDKLNEFKKRLMEFLKKEAADYTDTLLMNIDFFENCNRMHVVIIVQHRTNWQDFELQLARKSKILMFMKDSFDLLKISYLPPVQRIELSDPSSFGQSPKFSSNNLSSSLKP